MCHIRACQLGRQFRGGVDCSSLPPHIPERAVFLIRCSNMLRHASMWLLYARNQGQESGGDRGSFRDEEQCFEPPVDCVTDFWLAILSYLED